MEAVEEPENFASGKTWGQLKKHGDTLERTYNKTTECL